MTQASNDVAAEFEQAIAHHRAGRMAEAAAHYENVVTAQPRHAAALNLLGTLKAQAGDPATAERMIASALEVEPANPVFWSNHGNALTALGRDDQALVSYGRAIELAPGHHEAHYNRTKLLMAMRRHGDALDSLDRALGSGARHHLLLTARGNVLHAMGRFAEALAQFDEALHAAPRNVDAISGRGLALLDMKRPADALVAFEAALVLVQGHLVSVYGRAQAQIALSRTAEALATMDRVIAVLPKDWYAHMTRGQALQALMRVGEAVSALSAATKLNPQSKEAAYFHGDALRLSGRYPEAVAELERSLALDPDQTHVVTALAECAMQIADWGTSGRLAPIIARKVGEGASGLIPFSLLALSNDPKLHLACARAFTRATCPVPSSLPERRPRPARDRIRLGYLSGDFRRHAMAYQMVELFEIHDRGAFDVVGFSCGPDDGSPVRKRIFAAFDEIHDVSDRGNADVAALIRERDIDVLIDLNGHTSFSRIGALAWRPARVQATYLGFPGTSGAAFVDYVIADDTVAPRGEQGFFTEQIVYLPGCYQVSDSKRTPSPHVPSRASQGLPEKAVVFACFNSTYKISPVIFDRWMRILSATPGSVLWLVRSSDATVENLRREASARGVDPARLVFCGMVEPNAHLARHALADLYLDTLPYNSHGTGSFALWGGLPLLTCCGPTFAGRVAASLLKAVGLPELIATTLDDYETKAIELARDNAALAQLRQRLEQNRRKAPLFDTDLFRHHIEAAYRTMHDVACRGDPPTSFDVPPRGSITRP